MVSVRDSKHVKRLHNNRQLNPCLGAMRRCEELGSLFLCLIFRSSSFSPSSLSIVWVLDELALRTKHPCVGEVEGDVESHWKCLLCSPLLRLLSVVLCKWYHVWRGRPLHSCCWLISMITLTCQSADTGLLPQRLNFTTLYVSNNNNSFFFFTFMSSTIWHVTVLNTWCNLTGV